MPVKYENARWRFKSPGPITRHVIDDFHGLIMTIAEQGDFQSVIEDFKDRFAYGRSTSWSSDSSWSLTDMLSYMQDATENAPRFIAAFVDGCESQAEKGKDVPDIDIVNEILAKHETGYQVVDGTVVATAEQVVEQVRRTPVTMESPRRSVSRVAKPDVVSYGGSGANIKKPMALKAFLCHTSADKPEVKKLYKALKDDGFDPWLDAVNLLPGEDWEAEITSAVKTSHVVIVCLSHTAVTKAGFAQKEIKMALDVADLQPEGTIFIIPARLEDCTVPDRLSKWHWVNLYEDGGYKKLVGALKKRAKDIEL
jgi:hypothetical protein